LKSVAYDDTGNIALKSDLAHTITDGSTSLTLVYDSEHARVTQALTTASTTSTTTYLNDPINGAMGEKVATGGTNTWNDYLMADGRLIGERTCSAPAPTCTGAATWQYFVLDHLGSVAVVTDGSGTVLAGNGRLSFDAWGKQRNEDGSDDTTCSNGLTSPTTKGFTSQEEIAALCLVNLNARIYDPTIARFMAADTVVPDPYDGQSYNRYTYTDNRPLSFTDTTGNEPDPSSGPCGVACISPPDSTKIETVPVVGQRPPVSQALIPIVPGMGVGRWWVNTLTNLGATNIGVTVNSNGSLALKFTCSDAKCAAAGEEVNAMFGGTETFVGGEDTDAADNAQGLSDSDGDKGPYTTKTPAGLAALRKDTSTGIAEDERQLRARHHDSQNFWDRLFGIPAEESLAVWRNNKTGKYTAQFDTGPNAHSMGIVGYTGAEGWTLVLLEHTHPTPWGCIDCVFTTGYAARGPSGYVNGDPHSGDMGWTTRPEYSHTFFVIQDVDRSRTPGFIYYGKTALQ